MGYATLYCFGKQANSLMNTALLSCTLQAANKTDYKYNIFII